MEKNKLIGGVAVIEHNGKRLLIQQSRNKPNSGQWRHPGGKFESNETITEGLIREIKEETGLDIEIIHKKAINVSPSEYDAGNFGFFNAKLVGGQLKIDKREVEDAGWFTINEIKKLNLMNATRKFYEKIIQ